MAVMRITIVLALAAVASSSRVANSRHNHTFHDLLGEMASMPMQMYRGDCGKSRPVRGLSLLAAPPAKSLLAKSNRIPGAGIFKGEAVFDKVLKDGFYMVGCVKDSMYQFADKYGDNKHEYNNAANVSIVHYDMHVEKLEQESMTHEVCFAFCRTVPDMVFFGITNGRGCYCAPYFKPEASDSSNCDATCEGKSSQMCGGKTKSSVFQMHLCSDTAEDLKAAQGTMEEVGNELQALHDTVTGASTTMQSGAAALQAKFGQAGDPAASNLMQGAKQFAGTLEHAAEDAQAVLDHIGELTKVVEGLKGADFTIIAKATAAEQAVKDMEKATTAAEVQIEKLTELADLGAPSVDSLSYNNATNNSAQYYPIMYFVDKAFEAVPSTCSGEAVQQPLVGSMETCAAACDASIHSCVGFSYFSSGNSGICFLFSGFDSAVYYTGCDSSAPSTKCMAKLSSFEGTTLKPDGSGKCKQCLKEAKKANRCY